MPNRHVDVPTAAWSPGRKQYSAEVLLKRLTAPRSGAERVLGLADLDLFVPDLNFVRCNQGPAPRSRDQ